MKITSMRISGLFCPRSAPARVEFSTTSNFILSPTNVMKQIKTTVSPMLSPFGSQNPTPIWSPKQDSFSILLTSYFFLNEMWCETNQSETSISKPPPTQKNIIAYKNRKKFFENFSWVFPRSTHQEALIELSFV